MRKRAVIVHRRAGLEELFDRYSTRGQVEFFLTSRSRNFTEVQEVHDRHQETLRVVRLTIPSTWARTEVDRDSLSRFPFAPEGVIVVVGQDGLIASVAKCIDVWPVIGINTTPGRNPGVLMRCAAEQGMAALQAFNEERHVALEQLTMVRAEVDDTHSFTALNETFIGYTSHQSAHYRINGGNSFEDQSSPGIVISTDTGATGWGASLVRGRSMGPLPTPVEHSLARFVREAWPSLTTGVIMTERILRGVGTLEVTVTSDRLVVFGDGIGSDHYGVSQGQQIRVGIAERTLALVTP